MKKRTFKRGFNSISTMTAGIMDPLLQKKAGLNMRLVENWAEIVGNNVAEAALPLKIVWPRQRNSIGGAQLIIGCSGYMALKLQHETSEIIARINRFFGYPAIGKIKIEQKISPMQTHYRQKQLAINDEVSWAKTALGFKAFKKTKTMSQSVKENINHISDETLRASLMRLGETLHRD